jgi:cyclopropane fatty-acyl-phospholipid synthase-like methyltransferase
VAALPRERYQNVFEPGCSIGVLSELLAPRCERLLSTDIIARAVEQAQKRVRSSPQVRVELRAIPDEWPDETFDLIVLSEVAYYFDVEGLANVLRSVNETTGAGSHLLAVHWRGDTDYPQTADQVHEQIDRYLGWKRLVEHVEPEFRLGVWERL